MSLRPACLAALMALVALVALGLPPGPAAAEEAGARYQVETTAYTHLASHGGPRNALGSRLRHSIQYTSAGADWSRFPVGTRFRIVGDSRIYVVDDYGSALVGKDVLDLYHPSQRDVNRHGRRVRKIEIIEWGSFEKSLRILKDRVHSRHVRRMVGSLRKRASGGNAASGPRPLPSAS